MRQHHHLHHVAGGFVILIAIVACVLPSQTIQSSPGIDPNAIETSIAGTRQASAQQTEQAILNPPTATLIPTVTATPTPKLSFYGTSLSTRDDQSAVFEDHKAGIQLIIPAGWLPVRVNEDEYYKAFTLDVVLQNPVFHDHLTRIQDVQLDVVRLDAFDIRPGHIYDNIISDFNVIFEEGDVRSLEKWEQAERKRKFPYTNTKFISSSYPTLDNGTRVLVIEQSWDARGGKGTIYYRGVFFSLPMGTIVLDFYTNSDYKDTVLPDFDQVVNSLTLLNP